MVGIPLINIYRPLGNRLNNIIPVFPLWFTFLFIYNYLIAKVVKLILSSGDLYKGIPSSLSGSIVEIKETNFAVLFAISGLYLYQKVTGKPTAKF